MCQRVNSGDSYRYRGTSFNLVFICGATLMSQFILMEIENKTWAYYRAYNSRSDGAIVKI